MDTTLKGWMLRGTTDKDKIASVEETLSADCSLLTKEMRWKIFQRAMNPQGLDLEATTIKRNGEDRFIVEFYDPPSSILFESESQKERDMFYNAAWKFWQTVQYVRMFTLDGMGENVQQVLSEYLEEKDG